MNVLDQAEGRGWALYNADSTELLTALPEASAHLSVHSPPFIALYTYSPTERDLGNSTEAQFWTHYRLIIRELLRVTVPGRVACVHCMDIPAMLVKDGYIGIKDFPGDLIRAYEGEGWIYHGRVCIDKNPQALRHGTPVLTPTGWAPIENIAFGDEVIGANGKPTTVLGVWPQGECQIYRVTFSDGATIDCDGAHKWSVYTQAMRSNDGTVVLTTDELRANGLYMPGGKRRYAIPLTEPVAFAPGSNLPISPYLVGVLLGDGSITQRSSISVTTDHVIADRLELPESHHLRRQAGTDKGNGTVATYHVVSDTWHQNDVLTALRALGLQGLRAWEKHIPAPYLFASTADRRELLMGLLDTDGRIHRTGGVRFDTTSRRLADDVVSLVQSIGGLARVTEWGNRRYQYRGELHIGRPLCSVHIRLAGDWCPFSVAHKVDRWGPTRRKLHREIVSIEPVGLDHATCITVAAEDGLFLTNHCVVTHNSQAIRTHSKALLFAQLHKDSSWCRPALADYILVFRKSGDNPIPIRPELSNEQWINWASPLWTGISETDTLGYHEARDEDDERHIAPLQLGTIERCVRLWSNTGETVIDPFAGIGSTGHVCLQHDRRFIGVELKPSYYRLARRNLEGAEATRYAPSLFDCMVVSA